jgi:capsular exopolysaccharide synthesis family protein
VLGEVPALRGRSARPETGVIQAPQSALAEAYRHLRARISPLIASTDSRGKVLLVTSAQAGEGRTSVAINLAAVIALTGANVLLVDADLRNRTLGRLFQAADRPGLTDLLAGRARIGDVIKSTDFAPGLSVMTAGTVAIRPGDLLDAARLGRAFSQLTVLADVVIVDTGPVRAVSDPLALVPVADIVIMVAAVTAAVQDITGIRPVTVVGVLNRVAQPWRRDEAPVPGMRTQPTPATIIQEARGGEPATVADDAEAPGISANGGTSSSGSTSPDGSGPDEVQTAAWPLPSG